jgi:hypothetical protein
MGYQFLNAKHMDAKHGLLAKKPDEEMNSSMRTQVERQLIKKRQNVSSPKVNFFFLQTSLQERWSVVETNF